MHRHGYSSLSMYFGLACSLAAPRSDRGNDDSTGEATVGIDHVSVPTTWPGCRRSMSCSLTRERTPLLPGIIDGLPRCDVRPTWIVEHVDRHGCSRRRRHSCRHAGAPSLSPMVAGLADTMDTPPVETKDLGMALSAVAVLFAATGPLKDIVSSVRAFTTRFATRAWKACRGDASQNPRRVRVAANPHPGRVVRHLRPRLERHCGWLAASWSARDEGRRRRAEPAPPAHPGEFDYRIPTTWVATRSLAKASTARSTSVMQSLLSVATVTVRTAWRPASTSGLRAPATHRAIQRQGTKSP